MPVHGRGEGPPPRGFLDYLSWCGTRHPSQTEEWYEALNKEIDAEDAANRERKGKGEAVLVKRDKFNYKPAPTGLHSAICADVIDLGTVQTTWQGKTRLRKMVRLVWQTEDRDPETNKRYIVMNQYTASLGDKATLTAHLEAWRGRQFTEEELDGFELEAIVGVCCQLVVVHRKTPDGRIFANVGSVVPPPRGFTMEVEDYKRVKDREPEYVPKDKQDGEMVGTEPGPDGAEGGPSYDDDVPF